jgi:hypothetical protein
MDVRHIVHAGHRTKKATLTQNKVVHSPGQPYSDLKFKLYHYSLFCRLESPAKSSILTRSGIHP